MRSEVNGNLKNNFNGAMGMKTQLNWVQEKYWKRRNKEVNADHFSRSMLQKGMTHLLVLARTDSIPIVIGKEAT